jgi:Tfp pilus assembly protein PilX
MNILRERMRIFGPRSQEGAALLIAVLILLILTVLGVYAVTTSTLETKITGFHKWHVEAFYAADAGIHYTLATYPYGGMYSGNPTWSFHHDDPDCDITATYLGSTAPPVGSGTGVRAGFKAHHYRTNSVGSDSVAIASSTVDMWGYRIGF